MDREESITMTTEEGRRWCMCCIDSFKGWAGKFAVFVPGFTIFAVFSVLTSFAKRSANTLEKSDYETGVFVVQVIFLIVGNSILFYLFIARCKLKDFCKQIVFPSRRLNQSFLVLLGVAGLAYSLWQCASLGECIHENRTLAIILLLYYIFLFLFVVLQIVLLCLATDKQLFPEGKMRLRFVVVRTSIITIDVCIWLNSHEIAIFTPIGTNQNLIRDRNMSAFVECIHANKYLSSDSHITLFSIVRILFLEFVLHSMTVFIEISQNVQLRETQENLVLLSYFTNFCIRLKKFCKETSFRSCDAFNRKCSELVSCVCTSALSLCFVGFPIICILNIPHNYPELEFVHNTYDCVLSVVLLALMSFFSFPVFQTRTQSKVHFELADYFYIVAYFGTISHHVYEIHVGTGLELARNQVVIVFSSVIYVLFDLLQVYFLMKACKTNQFKVKSDTTLSLLKKTCILLGIFNLVCWVRLTVCIQISNDIERDEIQILEYLWETYSEVFIPLTAYYRFISTFRYNEVYSILTKSNDKPEGASRASQSQSVVTYNRDSETANYT